MAVKKVDGVYDAGFSYEEGSGWVSYDSSRTRPEEFIAKLQALTGFTARPVSDERTVPLPTGALPDSTDEP